jgi:hypothetical protein
MAESTLFWTTNGTGDGTGSGYTATQLFQLWRSFARTANLGGVFPDVLNELAVTGTATPVAVNTGQAIVYGIPYFNTASVNVAISTPASLTRVDYIVLRASYAAQTVRITRIAGTEGAGTPALTQSAGTTWDIPLATVSITTSGVITVTDAREWATGVGDLTIDSTKLAANAVTNAKLATMSANTVKANNTGSSAVPGDVDISTLLAAYIHGATAKTTPVSADELALIDSAASNVLKKVTIANFAAALGFVYATFTPSLLINGSATGITYGRQLGYAWKLGTLCYFHILIQLSSKGSGSGAVSLDGLPYTSADLGGGFIQPIFNAGFVIQSSAYAVSFQVVNNGTTMQGRIMTAAATTNWNPVSSSNYLQNTDINNSSQFMISGSYITT